MKYTMGPTVAYCYKPFKKEKLMYNYNKFVYILTLIPLVNRWNFPIRDSIFRKKSYKIK